MDELSLTLLRAWAETLIGRLGDRHTIEMMKLE